MRPSACRKRTVPDFDGCTFRDSFAVPAMLRSFPRKTRRPQETKQDDRKPSLLNITRTLKADGDKITFVADEGGKSWDVVNPEILQDHVGHHVELSAYIYKDKGQIHVMKVTML